MLWIGESLPDAIVFSNLNLLELMPGLGQKASG